MEKIFKRTISIIVITLLLISFITNASYAQSAEEELKAILTEYKDQLGDLNQVKEVMDEMYLELSLATEVTPEFKENLKKILSKLRNVEGINPLIADVLVQELEGQINVLTNDNLGEMKSEIKVIKEWVDEEIENSQGNGSIGGSNGGTTNPPSDEQEPTPPSDEPSDENQNTQEPEEDSKPSIPNTNTGNTQKDPTQSGNKLPHTGKTATITIVTILISGIAIFSIIKYKQLKEI